MECLNKIICPDCKHELEEVDMFDEGDIIIKAYYCDVCDRDFERIYEAVGWK